MPRGPKAERRAADAIGNAVHFVRIATGEIERDAGTDQCGSRTWPDEPQGESGAPQQETAVRDRQDGREKTVGLGAREFFLGRNALLNFCDWLCQG